MEWLMSVLHEFMLFKLYELNSLLMAVPKKITELHTIWWWRKKNAHTHTSTRTSEREIFIIVELRAKLQTTQELKNWIKNNEHAEAIEFNSHPEE